MATTDKKNPRVSNSDHIVKQAKVVLSGKSKKSKIANLLPFLGPAFIASVAYVDPGNFATNIAGGAQFGLTLLWVIVASNLMAILIQVVQSAVTNHSQLIILGTHGKAGMHAFWASSVAPRIVEQTKLPVLLVPIRR